jgi:5-methylcytosine-specific restriction enzyme subunit McrC
MVSPEREDQWVRRLFEKAVLGFAQVEFEHLGWKVSGGGQLNWQISSATDVLAAILPKMVTDILLIPPSGGRHLIVDTKFTSIYTANRYGSDRLKSQYIYQIYAYVRSREGASEYVADGMLLHPAVDQAVFEQAVIQGHILSFATINLSASSHEIREELRRVLASSGTMKPAHRPALAGLGDHL